MNEVLLNLPIPIKTKRLVIRPPREGDGRELNAAIQDSFLELHTWMEWADHMPTIEESEEKVREAAADWIARKSLPLLLLDKEEKTIIRASGFNHIDWKVPKCRIGYWRRTPYAGQGYITEAVNALTHYAFEKLGMARLEITCDEDNIKSRNVAERLGFVQEALLKNNARKRNGALRNTVIYARWDAQDLDRDLISW